jgi:hypothetical protein
MPKVLEINDGVRESVTRPVVFDIARQLQEWTGLGPTNILFYGDGDVAAQPGSTIDDEASFNRTAGQSFWRVKVKEEHRRDWLLATAVHQTEQAEIFYDEALSVYMRPVYSPTLLTFDFECRVSDVNSASKWYDEFRARVSTGRFSRTHVINYSYLIPEKYIPLLEHIHMLRESQAGYGEDLETYLSNHFTANVTKSATLAGTQERYAVVEQQGRIMGQFDFDELPDEPSKEGDGSTYTQTFSYKVYFDCPIATAMDYPVLVHNQLIDEHYLMYQPKDDLQTFESRSPRSATALGAFEVDRLARPTVKSGLRLPEFHEFYPRSVPNHTLQVLSALVGVENPADNPDNRKIMNFSEIDEKWEFRPEFLNHLKFDYKYLHKYGESLVNVTVYDNHMPLHYSQFFVDKDLNITLNFDPDLRRTYYVRLALVTDPSVLSRAAQDRARENAEGLILLGAAMCPDLVKNKMLPPVLGDTNYITRAEAEKFYKRIRQCTGTHQAGLLADHAIVQWNTVMILYIETGRMSELGQPE